MKEIKITDFENLQIGQSEDVEAGTGCTVFLFGKNGARAGLDVRGGGPASRESELMNPLAAAQIIHAVVLAGGSAYGLGTAGGVMKYLKEKGTGFSVGQTLVPLVCQSDIFDLNVGDFNAYPDETMGYEACRASGNYKDGSFGAGTGATVGKLMGMDFCMKSGIGSYALQVGDLKVGAVVVVNALGDIFDWKTGEKVAGLLSEDRKGFRSSEEVMILSYENNLSRHYENSDNDDSLLENAGESDRNNGNIEGDSKESGEYYSRHTESNRIADNGKAEDAKENRVAETNTGVIGKGSDNCETSKAVCGVCGNKNGFVGNTTIGVVFTNGAFDKTSLCKISGMAQNGLVRSINPVHTSADGDSIYAISLGNVPADRDLVGTLASRVVSEAILRAVLNCEGAYGIPSARNLRGL